MASFLLKLELNRLITLHPNFTKFLPQMTTGFIIGYDLYIFLEMCSNLVDSVGTFIKDEPRILELSCKFVRRHQVSDLVFRIYAPEHEITYVNTPF